VFESSPKVLNAVCDSAARRALSAALLDAGFGVVEARDCTQALRLAGYSPALIVFDALPDAQVTGRQHLVEVAEGSLIPILRLGADPLVDESETRRIVADARALLQSARADRVFRGFLETAPDAIILADAQGLIVQVNDKVQELFGYSRSELLGQPLDLLIPMRFGAGHRAHYDAYFRAPRPRRMGNGIELYGQRKNGDEFPVDVSLAPLSTESGELVAAAVRDMTEQRKIEAELRRRTHELEEADRHKDLFLLTLAHELRSPLTALVHIEPLLRLSGTSELLSRAAGIVKRQTAYMSRLIEDLVDISIVRSGKFNLHKTKTDLADVVRSAVDLTSTLIGARRHTFEQQLPPGPLWVDGDGTRLAQVVANVLVNAARYTPEGGRIALTLTAEADVAVIRIRDNGIGIAPDMLSHVFDLFTQVKGSPGIAPAGLGIGLDLVRKLVELHGGTAVATSDGLGTGSEFVIRIPSLMVESCQPG
jgi:PAS domain S-box-containing protein